MKTIFIRAMEASVDDKAAVIRAALRGPNSTRFEVDPSTFGRVPRSPFAYWVSERIRGLFSDAAPFESGGRFARIGLTTHDDFRWIRLSWECRTGAAHVPFAKGGRFAPFYADIHLAVPWGDNGNLLKTSKRERFRRGELTENNSRCWNEPLYFRPGLTWPRRTQGGLSLRVMPRGCIFADKGPAAFVENDNSGILLALAAITNSDPFRALVEMQMAFGSYEVGVIQRTPIPDLSTSDRNALAQLAWRSWSLRRQLDTRTENSHAFALPAVLQVSGASLEARAGAWAARVHSVQVELDRLQGEIDDACYRLYGISPDERQRIEQGFGPAETDEKSEPDDEDGDQAEPAEIDVAPMVESLLSWSVGVAFGRFDVRVAGRGRPMPLEPEPFDPLRACSPGMLTGDDGLPLGAPSVGYPLSFPTDGVLVDDGGHPRDLVRAVRAVFEEVFKDANARWHEAGELLGTQDLRSWFARDFFEQHIKRYSRSRRKAPIYWQFSTPSGSYSVWVHIHRATSDTLFRVLNDFVGPKLDHEKRKLDALTREAGASLSAAQRRGIDQQENFVSELQSLRAEVARIAPLWRPTLDDGVILNFAPLWRLVPHSRSWQTECKKAWDKLTRGDYDWAHLAMHLWPERAVPKCIDDRSLAIAHGLEEVFWCEDESHGWQQNKVSDAVIQKLIAERTSPTVKAALKDLLSAPSPTARGKNNVARAKGTRPRVATSRRTSATNASTLPDGSPAAVDPALLNKVKDAIARSVDGATKTDVIDETGITAGQWNTSINALLANGSVTKTGERGGARYHLAGRDA